MKKMNALYVEIYLIKNYLIKINELYYRYFYSVQFYLLKLPIYFYIYGK